MNPPQNPGKPPEPKSASYLLLFSLLFAGGIVVWVNRDYLRREWNIPMSKATPTPRSISSP